MVMKPMALWLLMAHQQVMQQALLQIMRMALEKAVSIQEVALM